MSEEEQPNAKARRKLPFWVEVLVFVAVFAPCLLATFFIPGISRIVDSLGRIAYAIPLLMALSAVKVAARRFGKVEKPLDQTMRELSAARRAKKRD
jgi:hypothetical protein